MVSQFSMDFTSFERSFFTWFTFQVAGEVAAWEDPYTSVSSSSAADALARVILVTVA
jgi:hypothetical protein